MTVNQYEELHKDIMEAGDAMRSLKRNNEPGTLKLPDNICAKVLVTLASCELLLQKVVADKEISDTPKM